MESKKNPEKDLVKTSSLFMNLGLCISLGLVITAFQWKFWDDENVKDLGTEVEQFEEIEEVVNTTQPPPPPPPKIQQPQIVEVPDEEEIEEEIEVDLDVEITEETEVEEVVFEEPAEEEAEEIFTIVEDQPEYPGGLKAFYKQVGKKLKYPSQARRMGVEGKVYVQFVVDKDGTLTEITVAKGIGAGCDEEAIRVLKTLPKWKPGKQRGRAVKVRMVIPIHFKLN
ncbi:protein TonB [Fulvitalea axinellae]|uniref:Protein TonB n=1 Tax=Fulvitalea axinellae TaxID=1182444 RepID=A0AAU9D0U1_9BACT|nr:protein TonB [Fulvitalea axinellae]